MIKKVMRRKRALCG